MAAKGEREVRIRFTGESAVLKGATLESLGFDKKDFDRIVAIK